MLKGNKWILIKEYSLISVGVLLAAAAVSVFFEPASLVTGGVTGLGIVLQDLLEVVVSVPVWLTNALLNAPIFAAAIKIKGLRYVGRTLFATAIFSPALYVTSLVPLRFDDILLCSVFGGALSGLGLGLVFRVNATTGGTDLLAAIIQHYKKHMTMSKLIFVLDFSIILVGLVVFGPEKSLYAIIAAFTGAKVITAVLEGLSYSKAAYIISDKSEEIGRGLMTELERGVTSLTGKGLYTGNQKNVILCVVSAKEIVRLKEISRAIDKDAFIIVSDVREVLGEGFNL